MLTESKVKRAEPGTEARKEVADAPTEGAGVEGAAVCHRKNGERGVLAP